MTGAIILAAGKGERLGNVDKAFLSLGPRPMVAYSLLAFQNCVDVDDIVLVVRKERIEAAAAMAKLFGFSKLVKIVPGGTRRQDSVNAGLNALPPFTKYVAIHDAARPLVTPDLISLCVSSAKKKGTGVAAHKVFDTIKEVDRWMKVKKTIDRDKLMAVSTPQVFSLDLLTRAVRNAADLKKTVTDDAAAVELLGEDVHLVEWRKPNIKVTVAEDIQLVSSLMRNGL